MAGWNGAGVFTVPYYFVQDSANGIKILSARQDTQWAAVVGGLMNCLCRDGQNAAVGNINLGNQKIINLANGVNPTDGMAFGQFSGAILSGPQFRKNWLLNGAMQISQRDVTNVVSVNAATGYVLDRWQASTGVGQLGNFSQITGISNTAFQYAQRVQRPSGSATTNLLLGQSLETADSYPLLVGSVTLSFYARAGASYSPTGSVLNGSVWSGNGTDQNVLTGFSNATQQINLNATLTTAWQRFQATASIMPGQTQLGVVFTMTPTGTAGANDYFDVTGVQLEVASAATDYDHQPWELMHLRCQRYCFKTFPYATVPAQNIGYTGAHAFIAGKAAGSSQIYSNLRFPVMMRATPTITTYSPGAATAQAMGIVGSLPYTALATLYSSPSDITFNYSANAGTAVGDIAAVHVLATAEL
jgi:hypothetical protein